MSDTQTEELLPDGSKRVTWKMAPAHKDGVPYEIVIVVARDGTTNVNGANVAQTEPAHRAGKDSQR